MKVAVIGGGNGNRTVISSLKDDFDVSAIVSMADNGGSTGRLRKEQGSSAVGDIRQCLVAFTDSEHSRNLFSYRFSEGELKGHSFGNLFLSTIEKATGDLYAAIDQAKNILNINTGDVIPMTDDKPQLVMEYQDKTTKGVFEIANIKIKGKEAKLWLEPESEISEKAQACILEADLVIIAPGNFYCSIIPALTVKGVSESLSKSSAKKVFISNLVNFANHTANFTAQDYLSELYRLTKVKADIVILNDNYNVKNGDEPVMSGELKTFKTIKADLLSDVEQEQNPNDKIAALRSKVSHDKAALNKIITQILRS